jgi:hypothetical protein
MRRSLLPLVFAVVVAACGGGNTTSPTSTATNPALPLVWAGSAWFSETTSRGIGREAYSRFEGTVTWQKDENLALPKLLSVPVGSMRYAISASQMHVTFHADGCNINGEADVALQPFQEEYPPDEPGDDPAFWVSYLIVGQDGEYHGVIHSAAILSVTKVCQNGFRGTIEVGMEIHLYIRGSLINGRRMQGEMPPPFASTTRTGGWDFQGR